MSTLKKSTTLLASLTVASLLSLSAVAEEPRVSDGITPGDSNSKWVVGGVIGAYENPYLNEGSSDVFIAPNIEYRGEKLFVKNGDIGYNLFRANGLSVGVVLTGHDSFLGDKDNYDNNDELDGIKERDGTLDAGVYLVHNSDLGQLRMKFLEEVTGEHDGHSFDANYTFDLEISNWKVNPVVGVSWASADAVDHFFGVSTQEATANRAAYEGENTTNIYTGVSGRYAFTENWDMNVGAYYVKLGSGISDSSIIEKDDLLVTGFGVNYNF